MSSWHSVSLGTVPNRQAKAYRKSQSSGWHLPLFEVLIARPLDTDISAKSAVEEYKIQIGESFDDNVRAVSIFFGVKYGVDRFVNSG